jgi:transcriptional regulator with XRE-family HTH domain
MRGVEPKDVFARNLRAVRERVELSQDALGRRSGLHRTEISLLERGGRDPQLATIVRLARALDVELIALLEGIR